jgi:murein DD-endopeptidase MepM/ murein hydrolase activator NlpD
MENQSIKSAFYTVQRGDTLTKIAKANNTTPQEIARFNHLSKINMIKVGQKLLVPPVVPAKPVVEQPIVPSETDHEESIAHEAGELFLKFVDVIEKPIENMRVWVKAGDEEHEHVTDARGGIPSVQIKKPDTPVEVKVNKSAGGQKTISTFTADSERSTSVLLVSPKLKVTASQQIHEGPPSPQTPQSPPATTNQQVQGQQQPQTPQNAPEPGTVINKRDSEGHPVQQVVLECPNDNNLRLGLNNKYRKFILEASARSGNNGQTKISTQAIAALLDAEAGTIKEKVLKNGKLVLNKKGKPLTKDTHKWKTDSKNPKSSATGLTQVIDRTWISLALTEGTFLNQKAKENQWITTTKIKNKKNEDKDVPCFMLSDGTAVIAQEKKIKGKIEILSIADILYKKYVPHKRTASDSNLQKLLDLRLDPECAIHTAVESGQATLKKLSVKGYKIDSLNDGELAMIIYICHHLGEPDVFDFIDNTMTADHAEYLLKQQTPDDAAKKAKEAGNDYLKAHRKWLKDFVANKIILTNHMCDTSAAKKVRDLLIITEAIKKEPTK